LNGLQARRLNESGGQIGRHATERRSGFSLPRHPLGADTCVRAGFLYITFYPATMLSVTAGRPGSWHVLGAAVVVTLRPTVVVQCHFDPSVLLYLFNGAAISGFTEFLHRARRRERTATRRKSTR
jgi:hypothetical protein